LRTVKLDVADQASIAAARAELGDGPLAGLVNNAGIAVAGPLEFMPLDQLRLQLEVNVVGQVAVIQQFLPALRAAGGRIVNLSSIGGRFALPLVSPYNASKFALEGISDSLRRELHGQGVDVILIEPGGVKTPIWSKSNEMADELQQEMPAEAERLYGRLIEGVRRATIEIAQKRGIEASEVAEVIGRALTAKRPRTRYLVGTDAKIRGPMAKFLPDRLMDKAVARQLGS
jgi:NAD(P)-dependent dehydrogenase (short-subunit alcohol dehydrogenase family)